MGIARRTLIGAVAALWLGAGGVWAAEITMTFGDSTPPYAFSDTGTGLEVDIVREALAHRGHTLVPSFVPAARVERQFKRGLVDAASKDPGKTLEGPDAFYADVSVDFYDVLISLSERDLTLAAPEDLDGLQVLAFQNAWMFFPNWLGRVRDEGRYSETSDQSEQVRALASGLVDVVVADRSIFNYHARQWASDNAETMPALTISEFQPPLRVRPVFRDAAIRDDFNAGLAHLKQTGRYDELVDMYLE
ncbi:ABC transporter substrate-binding protein [uncultured Tateyamaria sp.]|uniref:substrate-binding periplasmic protein n=1 Tax=uncultured Tateyamaria sp. TaxID=455651 RepID=UPI002617BCB9|nr:ABC transporter substrate-binding protein [uncultured Tateyamaria sp.]